MNYEAITRTYGLTEVKSVRYRCSEMLSLQLISCFYLYVLLIIAITDRNVCYN